MRHRELVVHTAVKEKGPQAAWAPVKAVSAGELVFLLVHADGTSVDWAEDLLTYRAPFRSLPCLRLIWPYQALDFSRLIPTRLRKIMAKMTGTSHLSGRWHPHA